MAERVTKEDQNYVPSSSYNSWYSTLKECAVPPPVDPTGAHGPREQKKRENIETVARKWWCLYGPTIYSSRRWRVTETVPPMLPCPWIYI